MSESTFQLFIDGRLRDSSDGRRTTLINPATAQPFGEASAATVEDVGQAVESAHATWKQNWRDLTPGRRAEVLFKIAAKIRQSKEELARLETVNIGKPISDALDEIELGARVFDYYAGAVSRIFGQTIPVAGGGFDFTLRQSMGVIAAIVPWNFPFPIACWKVAPALAAGNTVVLKPASLSPATAVRLGVLASEAGLPDGALQVIPGSGSSIGASLSTHPLIRKISFTGSTEVGTSIMAAAAKGIKRISLELGGKSPNIVFADANIDEAATKAPMSVFANTGQDCCARSRFLIERRVMDEFMEEFLKSVRALRVGNPLDPETQIGPMVSSGQRDVVEGFLTGATAAGRSIACGGDRPAQEGFFIKPAVVTGVETGDRIWRDEVFGPVVCIRPFDDEETMLEEVNASDFGLSGSIWTNDLTRALRVARRVESGVLSINTHSSVHVEAPFGGFKMSGIGRDLGMNAMEGYTELKNVYVAG